MVRRGRRRARGMTLIEVMVALLVTTVGLLGALAVVGISTRGGNFSRSTTQASLLAQAKLEQRVSLPTGKTSDSLPTVDPTDCFDVSGIATSSCSASTAFFTRTTKWTFSPDGKQRQMQVDVKWTDMTGPHAVSAVRTQALQ
jgi:prepilin-type N-terminal cleavage/methylation domain-containing protein